MERGAREYAPFAPSFFRNETQASIFRAARIRVQHLTEIVVSESWYSTHGRISLREQRPKLGGRTPPKGVGRSRDERSTKLPDAAFSWAGGVGGVGTVCGGGGSAA